VLGLFEAFELKDALGTTTSIYFKVNDDQYVEVTPNLKPGELIRQSRVVFQSSDVEVLHAVYTARGLNTGRIEIGADGNPVFHIVDPEGNRIVFYSTFLHHNRRRLEASLPIRRPSQCTFRMSVS
jgi:hypothetical protein